MKRLSNISPFILLLLPVFVMMLLTIGTRIDSQTQNEQVVLKAGKTSLTAQQNQ